VKVAKRVGVVGAGTIGGAIATNLAADGHWVAVHDTDPARRERMVAAGTIALDTVGDLAADCEFTFASLPTPQAMRRVADEWAAEADPGSILIDLSTNAPTVVREVGAALAARGHHLLEAPIAGGAESARSRELIFLVGGDAAVFARVLPLLERLGNACFHLGPLGSANAAKLATSLLAFASAGAALEALAVAAKSGLDLVTTIDVIRAAGVGGAFFERIVDGLREPGRPPSFALALAAKDATLAVDLAHDLGVPVHVGEEIRAMLAEAVGDGLGSHDFSDWVRWIERRAGVKLGLGGAGGKPA
jgi:3-hydroxyisobutyrate dehydrogenase-like beta-hydroxyacid dehydrogenase